MSRHGYGENSLDFRKAEHEVTLGHTVFRLGYKGKVMILERPVMR